MDVVVDVVDVVVWMLLYGRCCGCFCLDVAVDVVDVVADASGCYCLLMLLHVCKMFVCV